ncbi:MAG TPA: hypothetical protein VNT01_11035, partial [Symbiobacteriaceae bacterium]|nr:hypothetical protein [Symbiobacteriaceae bacterium]
ITIDDVTFTVDAVIQSPIQTVVRYTVTKPEFGGGYSWSNHEYSMRLEVGGEPIYSTADYDHAGWRLALFPRTKVPARLVMPAAVKGKNAEVLWPLEGNTVRSVDGVPVTLKDWEVSGTRMAVRFELPEQSSLVAISGFEVLDASGQPIAIKTGSSTWSAIPGLPDDIAHEFLIPEGARPAAVRVTRIAVPVQGPWVFDLPAK